MTSGEEEKESTLREERKHSGPDPRYEWWLSREAWMSVRYMRALTDAGTGSLLRDRCLMRSCCFRFALLSAIDSPLETCAVEFFTRDASAVCTAPALPAELDLTKLQIGSHAQLRFVEDVPRPADRPNEAPQIPPDNSAASRSPAAAASLRWLSLKKGNASEKLRDFTLAAACLDCPSRSCSTSSGCEQCSACDSSTPSNASCLWSWPRSARRPRCSCHRCAHSCTSCDATLSPV